MYKKNTFRIIELIPQAIWSLVEVKNYMRIEGDYDDDLISSLIDAAIMAAENFTKLTIITRRVEFVCNIKNQQNFQLKYQPIKELVKIIVSSGEFGARSDGVTPISNRRATSDDVPNFSSIDYTLTNNSQSMKLQSDQYYLDHDRSLLCLNKKLENYQLMIEYIVGYDKINIPASIKHGILMHIAEMYDRERQNATSLSTEIKNLYLAYRQLRI
ncbi:head-tail connector protein [Candidatus Tisiphia endosymbiont of Nemotelus uliginosus]|uniref:head-tail connector protein n=1 Tax=Candidatus Tisiphia endosymbiont of Nemotelus uliginosus TaxID=3077926 RepID=UPI0035C8E098